MAAFDTNRATHGSFGLIGRISETVAFVKTSIVEWNDARMTRNTLSELSDRELEDIGLIRGDIESVALSTYRR